MKNYNKKSSKEKMHKIAINTGSDIFLTESWLLFPLFQAKLYRTNIFNDSVVHVVRKPMIEHQS